MRKATGSRAVVSVLAGHEGIARGEPVHEAVLEQEIERPVDRDRGRPLAGVGGDLFDQFVGAERAPGAVESVEHPAAARRQGNLFAGAASVGVAGPAIGRAACVALLSLSNALMVAI